MPRKKEDLDQFEVIGRIPKGMAYQWCALRVFGSTAAAKSQLEDFEKGGWKPVPAKRHPKMRREDGRIVIGDQILMERKATASTAARSEEVSEAQARAFTNFASENPSLSSINRIKFTTSVGSEIPAGPFEPRDIEITLKLRLSANRVEAAAICGMSIERYATVMATLVQENALTGILIPTDDGKAFEFRELLVSRATEW